MKIRNKIALWITAAGLCASLIFSLVIFLELVEQPFEMVDADITTQIMDLGSIGRSSANLHDFQEKLRGLPFYSHSWLTIFDEQGKCLWRSALAKSLPVALPQTTVPFTVETSLSAGQIWPGSDEDDPLVLRLQTGRIFIGDKKATILAGRPMLDMGAEIRELVAVLVLGLAVAVGVLLGISFHLAGRILRPIDDITKMARSITDQTLACRIPLGGSKDELYSLSVTLNRMFDRLENSFARQKQLLADASHELKSPVAICRLQVEEALQQTGLQPQLENLLIKQAEVLHRTERLIFNLLDLTALEIKTGINPSKVCLAAIIYKVLDDYADFFEAWNIETAVDLPPEMPMDGDHDQLQRLMVNLIDNAAKYNQTNGRIVIKGIVDCDRLELEIANTGHAIPDGDLEHIFAQFYRVDKSRSQNSGGAGLGLAIARRIVELHGGRIKACGSRNGLTRFVLVFPVRLRPL